MARRKLRVSVPGFTRKGGVRVGRHTKKVPDRGAPGKTPKAERWYEPKGTMQGWNKNMSAVARRKILSHMVRTQGYAKVAWKLTSLRNVSTDRETDRIAKADWLWLKRKYR